MCVPVCVCLSCVCPLLRDGIDSTVSQSCVCPLSRDGIDSKVSLHELCLLIIQCSPWLYY